MTPRERVRIALEEYLAAKKPADKAAAKQTLLEASDETGVGIGTVCTPLTLRKVCRDSHGSAFYQRWDDREPQAVSR